MADAPATISLLDQIGTPGYRASVITTYSCYFPFYEQVVLRRLVAAGCNHNVLFVDAGRLAEALTRDGLRPRLAGTAYTLIPVHLDGAFHPKLLLQVGPGKGALHVGSHNLTLSGFGLNDEVSAAFRAEGSNPRVAAAPFHIARDFMRRFLPAGLAEVVQAFEAVFDGVTWMSGPSPVAGPPRELFTSAGEGEGLWDRIRASVPAGVTRALLVSPFFDEGVRFIRRVLSDIRPGELTVAIDPRRVAIPADASKQLPGVRFVSIAGRSVVPRRRDGDAPYVHAKAMWFEAPGRELLVVGSANASGPAMLSGESRRNAEAVVVDSSPGLAGTLGLPGFHEAPEVTAAEWALVTPPGDSADDPNLRKTTAMLATPSAEGFVVDGTLPAGFQLVAHDQNQIPIGSANVLASGPSSQIFADLTVRDEASRLAGELDGTTFIIVVHRPEAISNNAATDTRKALQQALGGLDDNPMQIDALLKLTEKVIFDVEGNVATEPPTAVGTTSSSTKVETGPQSLAVDAKGRRAAKSRTLARGDLAYLLDALIHKLGENLPAAPTRPLEEETIGADDEHGGDPPKEPNEPKEPRDPVDQRKLSELCRKKTKRLVRRMIATLKAASEPGRAAKAIVQLAAVLSVLRALCIAQRRPDWRRRGLTLVDSDALFDVFENSVIALVASAQPLLERAAAESGDFDEHSDAIGLLAAVAYLCDIDAMKVPIDNVDPDEVKHHWYRVQLLALLGPSLAVDEQAQQVLTQSLERFATGSSWLPTYLAFAGVLADLTTDAQFAGKKVVNPLHGDWVVGSVGSPPRLRAILAVVPASNGPKVVVADFAKGSGEKVFMAPRLRMIDRKDLLAAVAARRLAGAAVNRGRLSEPG